MRQKQEKLITTFHTTADALACEKVCKENKIEGRIIPVPRQLSSGCGLAWACEPSNEGAFSEFLKSHNVEFDAMQVILF